MFSSIPLVETLWNNGLKYVGTVRKNKTKIPQEFQPNRTRTVGSSLFAFKEYITMTSYVPKQNRAVILVSSHHHDDTTEENTDKRLPDIIKFVTEGIRDRLT